MNQQPNYIWSSFHDGQLTRDYEDDQKMAQGDCKHDFTTWIGNPMVNICLKCRSWHYKE